MDLGGAANRPSRAPPAEKARAGRIRTSGSAVAGAGGIAGRGNVGGNGAGGDRTAAGGGADTRSSVGGTSGAGATRSTSGGGASGTGGGAGAARTGRGGSAGPGNPRDAGDGTAQSGGSARGGASGASGRGSDRDSGVAPGTGGMAGGAGAGGAGVGPVAADAGSSRDAAATSESEATIVPDRSWACGMADGIPPPTKGTLAFRMALQLGDTHEVGVTPYGHRRVLDVKGGTITGDRFTGTVLAGGFDFELTLSNGVVEDEQIHMLKATDGTIIYLRTCGVALDSASQVRVVPDFEVDSKKSLAWLNTGKFVATRTVDAAGAKLELDVYDVSNVAVGEPRVQVSKPAGVPSQPWDCSKATGGKGTSVFSENVTLGSSLSVGTSDRGTRNVIPITGGTISGKLTGKIVPGGGDYQITPPGGTNSLDAKYVLAPNDGEFVVVRNCGPTGALVPLFETRADGPYSFLNANTYVSSDPAFASGGVNITFYERK